MPMEDDAASRAASAAASEGEQLLHVGSMQAMGAAMRGAGSGGGQSGGG